MTMYGMLFGQNSEADNLLALLRSVDADFNPPRFRDCYFDGTHIVVHTRTGGGNRECWCEGDDHGCCYVAANDAMTTHPWYASDADDDFDSTYADWRFTPPPEIAATLQKADITPAEKWQVLFKALEAK